MPSAHKSGKNNGWMVQQLTPIYWEFNNFVELPETPITYSFCYKLTAEKFNMKGMKKVIVIKHKLPRYKLKLVM